MKIFLDTANVATIQRLRDTGLIDGVTTNPTHLSKEGSDPVKVVKEICALLPDGHISVEVTEQAADKVYAQAKAIAQLADNVVVKIPCHFDYYPVIKKLVHEKVPLNITLVFSLMQGLCMSKLGVMYISPFVGRLDDIDVDGVELLADLREMLDTYGFETQLLAASLRHVRHLHAAIDIGADVATLPPELFEKSVAHPLTNRGIELFNADWQKLGVRSFP